MAIDKHCTECGMLTRLGEYHPYAACLMFKGCHDSETVRANLDAVTSQWRAIGRRAAEQEAAPGKKSCQIPG